MWDGDRGWGGGDEDDAFSHTMSSRSAIRVKSSHTLRGPLSLPVGPGSTNPSIMGKQSPRSLAQRATSLHSIVGGWRRSSFRRKVRLQPESRVSVMTVYES